MPAPENIPIGAVYGQLTILGKAEGTKRTTVIAQCSCGIVTKKNWSNVKRGLTTSCGCVGKTFHKTHGDSKNRLYSIWVLAKARCEKPYATGYQNYGGRGIKMDFQWSSSYETFKTWALSHGYSQHLTLERKDVNGDYTPENCIWADQSVQSANSRKRSTPTKHTFKGVDQLPSGRWRAILQHQGKRINLGTHLNERNAVEARNKYIRDNALPHLIQ